jgi:hypothetical protein
MDRVGAFACPTGIALPAAQTDVIPSQSRSLVMSASRVSRYVRMLCVIGMGLGIAVGSGAASAQRDSKTADTWYQTERAKCLNGPSGEDRATCLKEAGAAADAARRGQLSHRDEDYRRNALARCDGLPAQDEKDCRARIEGAPGTSTSGSVEGGGILRKRVTVVPATPGAAAASAAASQAPK